ncbi:hypothetical protein [Candidatus Neptunochlamydia vexilliferae]|uniref:Uncharacterized protein n=1 Tax=Candidatus Neptunichlamydia vexilliferae TaxID=1651774 RepID=A0ABS0AWN6_9BACT|nr:hypothetical protein [Candidatus Neptunochlamydia vexilliferae]MBF5058548.1 hypothetical protein [Candidatus Neptunochlamydia vexilliferae]
MTSVSPYHYLSQTIAHSLGDGPSPVDQDGLAQSKLIQQNTELKCYYDKFGKEMLKVRSLLTLFQENSAVAQGTYKKSRKAIGFFQFCLGTIVSAAPLPGAGAIGAIVNSLIDYAKSNHEKGINKRLMGVIETIGKADCEYIARAMTIRYAQQILQVQEEKRECLAVEGVLRFLLSILKTNVIVLSHEYLLENIICNIREVSYKSEWFLKEKLNTEGFTINGVYTKPGLFFVTEKQKPYFNIRKKPRSKDEASKTGKYGYFFAFQKDYISLSNRGLLYKNVANVDEKFKLPLASLNEVPVRPSKPRTIKSINEAFKGIADSIKKELLQGHQDIHSLVNSVVNELNNEMKEDVKNLQSEVSFLEEKVKRNKKRILRARLAWNRQLETQVINLTEKVNCLEKKVKELGAKAVENSSSSSSSSSSK